MAKRNAKTPAQREAQQAENQRKKHLASAAGRAEQQEKFGFSRDTSLYDLVRMDSTDFDDEKLAAWQESQHQHLINAEIGRKKVARQEAAAANGKPNKQFKRAVKQNPVNIEYRPGQPGGPMEGQRKFTSDGQEQIWNGTEWGKPIFRNENFYDDLQLFEDESGFVYDPTKQGGAGSEFKDNFDWTFNDQLAYDEAGGLLPGTNPTPRDLNDSPVVPSYGDIQLNKAAAIGSEDVGAMSKSIGTGPEQSRISAGGDLSVKSRGLQSVLGGIRSTQKGRNLGISV